MRKSCTFYWCEILLCFVVLQLQHQRRQRMLMIPTCIHLKAVVSVTWHYDSYTLLTGYLVCMTISAYLDSGYSYTEQCSR